MKNNNSKNYIDRIIIVILIFVIFILGYYIITTKNQTMNNNFKDLTGNIGTTEIKVNDEEKIIIGMENCLMGSFEDDIWYNVDYGYNSNYLRDKEFYIQDIEKYSKLYLHQYNKDITEMNDFIDKNESYEYVVDSNGKIIDDHLRFKYLENSDNENIKIITNCNENIFTIDMKEIQVVQLYQDIVNKVKDEKNVSKIDTEITKAIEIDYNKDGNKEVLLIVNPVRDDLGYVRDEDGACCFVIMIQNEDYKIIYEDIVYKNESYEISDYQIIINDALVCDLNYNNEVDICLSTMSWDIPMYVIYEYDNETKDFEMELCGTFAW